jgi:hypothetical protein
VVLRAELLAVGRKLLEGKPGPLTLDQIAEALGTLRVTADEIDALFSWLEARGREVGAPLARSSTELLRDVLGVARSLRQELGRTPHAREIAERASLSLDAVQRALFFARILQR